MTFIIFRVNVEHRLRNGYNVLNETLKLIHSLTLSLTLSRYR